MLKQRSCVTPGWYVFSRHARIPHSCSATQTCHAAILCGFLDAHFSLQLGDDHNAASINQPTAPAVQHSNCIRFSHIWYAFVCMVVHLLHTNRCLSSGVVLVLWHCCCLSYASTPSWCPFIPQPFKATGLLLMGCRIAFVNCVLCCCCVWQSKGATRHPAASMAAHCPYECSAGTLSKLSKACQVGWYLQLRAPDGLAACGTLRSVLAWCCLVMLRDCQLGSMVQVFRWFCHGCHTYVPACAVPCRLEFCKGSRVMDRVKS